MGNEFPSEELLLEIVGRLNALQKQVGDAVPPEKGWSPTFLTTPYSNASFNGDSFSDVAANTKIENTSWSTTIPSDAKALILRVVVRDSGSAGATTNQFMIFPTSGAAVASAAVNVAGLANDALHDEQAIVPCTDGDIWYQVDATGASTMDVWMWCIGYWR